MARTEEFHRDMAAYLKGRRVSKRTNPFLAARKYFQTMFHREEEEKPLEYPPEQIQAVIEQSRIKRPVAGIRNTPMAAPMKHAPPQSAPQKQKQQVKPMGWLFGNKRQDEDFDETIQAQPVLDEDVKEVLKITFRWLKRMDQDTIEEIKASPDFEKYKQVLDKYGLIKK